MSTFTLAISCLPTSNLSWFMDLTFQVPMQYCSLQHWTLLPSPVPFTIGCCFCFGSIPSFFLEFFLHWSPVIYWAPTDLGSVLSFCLFIMFRGFSRQEYWSGLPFPSPVDHILSDLSTMAQPSWVALYRMAHSFIELDKVVVPVIRLASCLSLIPREMQIKITVRYHLMQITMAAMKMSTNNKCWRACAEKRIHLPLVGMQTGTTTMESSVEIP